MNTTRNTLPTFVTFAIAGAFLFLLGGALTVMSPQAQVLLMVAAIIVAAVGLYAVLGARHRQRLLEEQAELEDRIAAFIDSDAELRLNMANATRAPLTHIVGFSDRLLTDELIDTEERRRMLRAIRSDAREVAQALADIAESQTAPEGLHSMGVVLVDEEVRAVVATMPTDKSFVVDLEPVRAWADAVKVRQIIRTLIKEAHDFGCTSLSVHTFNRTRRSVISISTDGEILPTDALAALTGNTEIDDERSSSFLATRSARLAAQTMGGTIGFAQAFGKSHAVIELDAAPEIRTQQPKTVERRKVVADYAAPQTKSLSFAAAAGLRPERPTASIRFE